MGVSPFEFPRIFGTDPATEQALRAPIGAVSPLWLAFAGAASAGAAYWWMTRWMRPFHLEAALAPAQAVAEQTEAVVFEAAVETPPAEVAAPEPVVAELAHRTVEVIATPAPEPVANLPVVELAPETAVEPTVAEAQAPKAKAAKPAARKPASPAAIAAPTTRPAASRRPPRKITPVA